MEKQKRVPICSLVAYFGMRFLLPDGVHPFLVFTGFAVVACIECGIEPTALKGLVLEIMRSWFGKGP